MNTALVIVDVQADFCSGGALAVPDADAVIPVVNELIAGFGLVFFTQDWHPPGLVGLNVALRWRCRGVSYSRSRPDFPCRRRPALKPSFSQAIHATGGTALLFRA